MRRLASQKEAVTSQLNNTREASTKKSASQVDHEREAEQLEAQRGEYEAAWKLAEGGASAAELSTRLERIVSATTREILVRLYPQASAIFEGR